MQNTSTSNTWAISTNVKKSRGLFKYFTNFKKSQTFFPKGPDDIEQLQLENASLVANLLTKITL